MFNVIKILTIPLFLFLILNFGCEQKKPAIAEVGGKTISQHEFEMAYRFNPYLASVKNDSSAKKIILNTLIAEKLLAIEAEKQALDQGRMFRRMVRQFNHEAVIEKLWQDEVFDDLRIEAEELRTALVLAHQEHVIQYITFDTQLAAKKAEEYLATSFTFEQIAELNGYARNEIPADTLSLGSSFENLENAVFKLHENEISHPVKIGNQFVLAKKIVVREKAAIGDQAEVEKKIRKIISERKGRKLLANYINKNLNDIRYELNRNRFRDVVIRLQALLFTDATEIVASEKDLRSFPPGLPDEILRSEIVRFSDGASWTVKQLLQQLEDGPYPVERKSKAAFQQSMIAATKMNLDNERFYRYALKLKLDQSEDVRNETQMWSDFMLAQRMKQIITRNDPHGLQAFIAQKNASTPITIHAQQLMSLPAERSDMVVMKTHFPLRTIAPVHEPLIQK